MTGDCGLQAHLEQSKAETYSVDPGVNVTKNDRGGFSIRPWVVASAPVKVDPPGVPDIPVES
jgi:2-oxoglutarate dehydrogenase complex dehydrogenase (E1) component-like enzyme